MDLFIFEIPGDFISPIMFYGLVGLLSLPRSVCTYLEMSHSGMPLQTGQADGFFHDEIVN